MHLYDVIHLAKSKGILHATAKKILTIWRRFYYSKGNKKRKVDRPVIGTRLNSVTVPSL